MRNHKKNNQYYDCCLEILANLNLFLKVSATIGLSNPFYSLMNIGKDYNDAMSALYYKFYIGQNSIISINDVSKIITEYNLNNNKFIHLELNTIENKIINSIKGENYYDIKSLLNEFFEILLITKASSVDHVQSLCTEFLLSSIRSIFDLDDNINVILPQRYEIVLTIFNAVDIFQLKDYILSLFNQITNYIITNNEQKNAPLIKAIKNIISKRYMENLSVAKISEEVYLTPNYISLIFRQETGLTITKYITKVRMEAAKILLKTTNFKVFEISEMVGYDQPHYFSTVFKKYTGIQATKYSCLTNSQDDDN